MQSSILEPLLSALSYGDGDDEDESVDSRARKRPRLDFQFSHLVANARVAVSEPDGAMSKTTLKKALLKLILDVASEEQTRDANRRKLYAFWRSYADDEAGSSD